MTQRTQKERNVDVCILGGGSGGLYVAAGAAQLGFKTVLIEQGKMGGDCLNYGCVPSKALIAAAHAAHVHRSSTPFGVPGHDPGVDMKAVAAHVRGVIEQIEPHDSVERYEALGCDVLQARGRFTGPRTIQAGETTVRFRYAVIATGSHAGIPPIEGLKGPQAVPFYTNETIFEVDHKIDHLVVIGGGPIGSELAQAHRRLGARVSLLDVGPVMPRDDQECAEYVRAALRADGIDLFEKCQIRKLSNAQKDGPIEVELTTQEGQAVTLSASHLLVAAGRVPNVEDLGLAEAGIVSSRRGVQIDQRLRTANKRVFAVGDVVGPYQFTHMAGYHGNLVIKQILFRVPRVRVDYRAVPWVTYTDPELAHAGLTEAQAAEQHTAAAVHVVRWNMEENDRARAERQTEGLVKIVLHGRSKKILGATIVGPHAGELIVPWVMAIQHRYKIGRMTDFIVPYPTLSEVTKRVAGQYYYPTLFSPKTKRLLRWLRFMPML